MHIADIQDILERVEKPSRYLGTEVNHVVKDLEKVALKVALAFPDLYEVGTSHFGIQILYDILNRQENIAAERVFAPANDMASLLKKTGITLFSLENKRPLNQFDIIGFSLLYELNYTNVLNMLDLSGIELRSRDRTNERPIIIAGGPCVCNPEPMADFFDAMVFGDGEKVFLQMCRKWIQWKSEGSGNKKDLLRQWSFLEGVYVPGQYTATYGPNGFQTISSEKQDSVKIRRAIVADLDKSAFPVKPLIPFGRPVHDRLRLEVSRGCSRGCRFCQAGMIYRPVRERSPQRLIDIFQDSFKNTGYEDLSLLSLSTGDYTCLDRLIKSLIQRCQKEVIALSLPSVRAGTLTASVMEQIKKIRKTGFTIAPEAGSQRLRDVINKNIRYEDVESTVKDAFHYGWQVIKLYFMIGLPTETQADLDAIVDMVQRLKRVPGPAKRRGQLNVSITTFVPKPHTPFQWESQLSTEQAGDRLEYLKKKLRIPGVQVKWQHPDMSFLEGVLSRGDRRISHAIEKAFRNGARFDGWTDQFDITKWDEAFNSCKIDTAFFTTRMRSLDEPLPWDHMKTGVSKSFLQSQWHHARRGIIIEDCRYGKCHNCGVCDLKNIKPIVFKNYVDAANPLPENQGTAELPEEHFHWVELVYSRLGEARFFGHLEQANLFSRLLRQSGLKISYSKGFHPMPRISFDDPLPLGMESEEETFRVLTYKKGNIRSAVGKMNSLLPEGLKITGWRVLSGGKRKCPKPTETFCVDLREIPIDPSLMERFSESERWEFKIKTKSGKNRILDLKCFVETLSLDGGRILKIRTRQYDGRRVRPVKILSCLLKIDEKALDTIRVRKLKTRDKCDHYINRQDNREL